MKKCVVFKYIKGRDIAIPAGELRFRGIRSRDDEVLFTYSRGYLREPGATPVDPLHLPLMTAPILLSSEFLGGIRDAAPDYWGRMVIGKALGQNFETLHEIDFLVHGNAARVGNLDFRPSITSPEPVLGPPEFANLADLLAVAEEIEHDRVISHDKSAFLQLLAQGSSLGGARPKCTVRTEDGHLWVAKFPALQDRWSNARVEGATMELASCCGIQVPDMRLESIAGKEVLLVKRFDRDGEYRIGYLSGLTVLGVSEMDRLGFSYLLLADMLRRHSPSNLEELFRRMVFNVLCRNTDDHPRNHGFLYDSETLWLAPAFDITPTPSIPGVSTIPHLSMCAGSRGSEATMENCLSECERFGLYKTDARAVIDDIQRNFGRWKQIFAEWNVSEHDLKLFNHTFSRWDEPCQETLQESLDSPSP